MTLALAMLAAATLLTPMKPTPPTPPGATDYVANVIAQERFTAPKLTHWRWELEHGGTVTAAKGIMDINVPGGATVWYRTRLTGPVIITYQVRAVQAGGPNDRVSDMNCFWMAHETHNAPLATRTGKFSDYDTLNTYYVGQGGNSNTTTRFRRYIGTAGNRPLRPQDDLHDPSALLTPNTWRSIEILAWNHTVQYDCDGKTLFVMQDPAPYRSGWFGLRTTKSHLQVRAFTIIKPGRQVK